MDIFNAEKVKIDKNEIAPESCISNLPLKVATTLLPSYWIFDDKTFELSFMTKHLTPSINIILELLKKIDGSYLIHDMSVKNQTDDNFKCNSVGSMLVIPKKNLSIDVEKLRNLIGLRCLDDHKSVNFRKYILHHDDENLYFRISMVYYHVSKETTIETVENIDVINDVVIPVVSELLENNKKSLGIGKEYDEEID